MIPSEDDDNSAVDVVIPESHHGMRLDKALSDLLADVSRTRLQSLIGEGQVFLNDAPVTVSSCKIKAGDRVMLDIPPLLDADPEPENIPLTVVYEDDDLLVIDKPAGLVVHPGAGNHTGTLVNALLYHCGDTLSGIGGVKRPGIVHRLDKDTSGLMVIAKNDTAHRGLSEQLVDRSLTRIYKALVWRVPMPSKGIVKAAIGRHAGSRVKMSVNGLGAREAITHYQLLEGFGGEAASLVECHLETGRTHQIRVHMASIRHPLVGDPLYGAQPTQALSWLKKGGYDEETQKAVMAFPRQALHAEQILFVHPVSGEEIHLETPIPADLADLINLLK